MFMAGYKVGVERNQMMMYSLEEMVGSDTFVPLLNLQI